MGQSVWYMSCLPALIIELRHSSAINTKREPGWVQQAVTLLVLSLASIFLILLLHLLHIHTCVLLIACVHCPNDYFDINCQHACEPVLPCNKRHCNVDNVHCLTSIWKTSFIRWELQHCFIHASICPTLFFKGNMSFDCLLLPAEIMLREKWRTISVMKVMVQLVHFIGAGVGRPFEK